MTLSIVMAEHSRPKDGVAEPVHSPSQTGVNALIGLAEGKT